MSLFRLIVRASFLLLIPTFASAGDIGLDTSVYASYGFANGTYDKDGKKTDLLDGTSGSFLLIDLGVNYQLMDRLKLNIGLPLVQKSFKMEAIGLDESTFGLGDPSIGATYSHNISAAFSVRGALSFKIALGKKDHFKANASRGDHHLNAKFIISTSPIDNLGIDLDGGYILTLGGPTDGADMGDIIYTNLYLGYEISGLTPRLGVHFFTQGEPSNTTANLLREYPQQGISLTFDLAYEISDGMTVNAGIGTRQIHEGTNLPWGFALMGKNVKYGRSFGLGFKAEF
ncbi:MAG: transporter [Myxococcota bacterium]|nr:transporter [Myxococcota bacterium]